MRIYSITNAESRDKIVLRTQHDVENSTLSCDCNKDRNEERYDVSTNTDMTTKAKDIYVLNKFNF